MAATLAPARLPAADLIRAGAAGLRARRLRSVLSGLGIAIGIASMVAVLGISSSSQADLIAQLDRLGTNVLSVTPGQSFFGEDAELPEPARGMITRISGVEGAAAVRRIDGATVRRTRYVPEGETSGIGVVAVEPALGPTVGLELRAGRFLDAAAARYPALVLGSEAAVRLGITRPGIRVWLGGRWFTVIGILRPAPLAPGLDTSALVGFPIGEKHLRAERTASTLYVRTRPERLEAVRDLLGATANPQRPEEVQVSRPSDALAARAAAKTAFTSLFLGLGAVALLVGGVGIANVMVIAVLERRREIGLRRALGARRRHVAAQFLAEALLLAGAGGAAGVILGSGVTVAYATAQDWRLALPVVAPVGGLVAAVAIGAVAGLYPAVRAARLAPAEALRAE